jgi:isoprenylcysteine carboxyl methyltransferase (ICMT) family protein YpbQ
VISENGVRKKFTLFGQTIQSALSFGVDSHEVGLHRIVVMKTFTIFYLAFFVISLFIRIWKRSAGARKPRKQGKISYKRLYHILYITYWIVLIGSILEYFLLDRKINYFLSVIAVVVYVSANLGRDWAIKSLGEYWSVHVEIRDDHKLIKKGPYKYLRHPNSLCIIAEVLALPLIPNSYYSFLFSLLFYVPLLILRMYLEEKELINKFGKQYLDYKAETWAVFPFKPNFSLRKKSLIKRNNSPMSH